MSADHALQTAVRLRLVATPAVTALVPASSIGDVNERPVPMPSIIIGEGQSIEGDQINRRDQRVFLDMHVWQQEEGLREVKDIAGAIRAAIHSSRLNVTGWHCGDCRVSAMRFLRDPDGKTAHSVVTVEALMVEIA